MTLPGSLLILFGILAAGVFVVLLSVELARACARLAAHLAGWTAGVVAETAGILGAGLALTGGLLGMILGLLRAAPGEAARAAGRAARSLQRIAAGAGRLALVHPLRLFGIEVQDPLPGPPPTEALAGSRAPEPPPAAAPDAQGEDFPGYRIVGRLRSGGSGARLWIAEPDAAKRGEFRSRGHGEVGRVVLKAFSLQDEGALPHIVRENRALEAARSLGLVLDHGLNERRFYYVTPYVPGEDLRAAVERLHAQAPAQGLGQRELATALGWVRDLLQTLERYHAHGLWHKDIKPENIIVSGGRAHLVDLGLVTPLASAMTLTTTGTEYYRDPELVRLALRGVQVREVDGVKFDLYGVGAVLYTILENNFPAHGSLSPLTRRCPEALRWILRRSMADLRGRYASARQMLLDVEAVRQAEDPFALRPAELPSLGGRPPGDLPPEAAAVPAPPPPPAPGRPFPVPPPVPSGLSRRRRRSRRRSARPVPLVPVFLFLGFAAVFLYGLLGTARLEGGPALTHTMRLETAPDGSSHAVVESDPAAPVQPAARTVVADLALWTSGEEGWRKAGAASVPHPGEASGRPCTDPACRRGRLLLLDEIPARDEAGRAALAALAASLLEDGYELLAEAAAGDEAVELLAAARLALGPVASLAAAPREEAAAWLRAEDRADGLLLALPAGEGGLEVLGLLEEGGPSAGHLRARLRGAALETP